MREVLAFLQENSVFYLATMDHVYPKVRPFGFVMEYEGKLYFSTSNQKHVYRQLKENPYFEISTASKTGEWLRLHGKAVFDTNRHTKQAALAAMPVLSKMYSVDDPIFELFYAAEAEATFSDLQGTARTVTL
ncbi:pyridoxamine 5'-phosphate oxidase family protein [Sporomusa sphaeroides DSM 2875]|uniref:pyridoxamine 5'-phosphate oxidase family protein n=1 Tax=Sporomusa sphaeroides TaxID=47679 RepID=UPI0020301FCB|nr:pyridoxamine 5'-phosphate oxidase family protein [Sporomusa sphaeroides]MCM0757752.1 pyridoxamine 5'-phosphate oxidase family protein [Sporomusa sphaeroides DSM 2875]